MKVLSAMKDDSNLNLKNREGLKKERKALAVMEVQVKNTYTKREKKKTHLDINLAKNLVKESITFIFSENNLPTLLNLC